MVYIGQTRESFLRRYLWHWWSLKSGQHSNKQLQEDWVKFGESLFTYSVLEVIDKSNAAILDSKEQYYIKQYKDMGLCYNILEGGNTSRKGVPMSDEAKRKIGDKNRQHMTGRKRSIESKAKQSATIKGKPYTYNKVTNVLNDDIAFQIKTLLIQGVPPSKVSKILDVEYKFVNNIISSNTWKHVYVDGWNEFRDNRKIITKITEEEYQNILNDYFYNHLSKPKIAEKYNRHIKTICSIIHKYNAIS